MRRGKAEECLDDIRAWLALRLSPEAIERKLRLQYGLEPFVLCTGEAHACLYIDHCSRCSPRWGALGDREKVT